MSPTWTIAVTFAALISLVGIDIVWAADKRKGNTFSEVWRGWFRTLVWVYYLLAFILGVLMAHWAPT